MSGEIEENKDLRSSQLSYLMYFYQYLFVKKPVDLLIFISLTFLLPVIPYIWVVAELHMSNESESHLKSFYGDGSIITLCAGILCSYFAILFDNESEKQKGISILINIGLIILYVCSLFVFVRCQMNFSREWAFIFQIFLFSGFLLLSTFCTAAYLNFNKKVDYTEIKKFMDDRESKKIAKKAGKTTKTSDGVTI